MLKNIYVYIKYFLNRYILVEGRHCLKWGNNLIITTEIEKLVIKVLEETDSGVTSRELSLLLGVSVGTVEELLCNLVANGLIAEV